MRLPDGRQAVASIEDVARATGVSTATVSRALRGLSSVAEPTRMRVQESAVRLGYVPSSVAASLATGRTKAIGLVTPHVAKWFFSTAIETVEAILRTHGYDVLLIIMPPGQRATPGPMAGVPPWRPQLETELLRKRVDATIILSLPMVADEVALLHDLGQELVGIGPSVPGLPIMGIDDVEVGVTATQHLLDLGHTRLRFVGHNAEEVDWTPPQERYRGFTTALRRAGLTEAAPPLGSDLTVAEGRRAARAVLADNDLPTGLVCCSDEVAMGVLYELRRAGVAVPAQISVIGVDDHPHAELHDLTTVAQCVDEQAEAAVRWLLAGLGTPGIPPRPLAAVPADGVLEYFPTHLIVRNTTSTPP